MNEINLNARRNNLVTFMTRAVVVLVLWICLVVSGLFFFITEESNKKMTADQHVELMMEHLHELQLEALGLFIYSNNLISHDLDSVLNLSEKEQALESGLTAQLDEMVKIYQEIDAFPTIELDVEALLTVQDVKRKTQIIEVFQARLEMARTVLHEFKWLKKQEYLVNFQLFQKLVFISTLITLLGVILTFILIRKRLFLGLDNVLGLVKKYHHKQYSFTPDWSHNDEFREIFFHLQQLKESSLVNASVINRDKRLLEHYFQNIQEPCLALNTDRRYVFCNKLFELIWSEYQVELEVDLCDHDEPTLELMDIRVAEIEGNESLPHLFRFNGLAYSLTEEDIHDEGRLIGYLLKFSPVSEELEYEAVSKLVSLMAVDVWNAPVRVMREGSRVGALATQLEKIRLTVKSLLNLFDGMTLKGEPQKTASLKDISELVISLSESLVETETQLNEQEQLNEERRLHEIEIEIEGDADDSLDLEPLKNVTQSLRQKVEGSIFYGSQVSAQNLELIKNLEANLLIGYENLTRSLTIVYKGVETSVSALQDSYNCMSEVKVALLNAIIDKDDRVIEKDALQSAAIDLSHDIDTVSQMLQSSLQQEKEALSVLEGDIESCQNRSLQAKNSMQELSEKNKDIELVSQSESMMIDVFKLDDVLDGLIKKSKP